MDWRQAGITLRLEPERPEAWVRPMVLDERIEDGIDEPRQRHLNQFVRQDSLKKHAHIDRLVVIAVGHPSASGRPTLEELQKGWYRLLFQFEGLAEELVQQDDWYLLRELLQGGGDIDRYIEDLSQPGALTAALTGIGRICRHSGSWAHPEGCRRCRRRPLGSSARATST